MSSHFRGRPEPTHSAQVKTGKLAKQPLPAEHAKHLCTYHEADQATVASAIEGALAAKTEWEALPWNDRAAIFLKAADLVSGKYRYKLMAATILGQGKNAWQAEIDAAAEVCVPYHDLQCRSMGHVQMLTSRLRMLALRLLQVRSKVCRRALLSAAHKERAWCMEVRSSLCIIIRSF